jgi:G:T-mismatch repair DNA endonuclease (very short patch repair protein)
MTLTWHRYGRRHEQTPVVHSCTFWDHRCTTDTIPEGRVRVWLALVPS